jgi:hypothetical protein
MSLQTPAGNFTLFSPTFQLAWTMVSAPLVGKPSYVKETSQNTYVIALLLTGALKNSGEMVSQI